MAVSPDGPPLYDGSSARQLWPAHHFLAWYTGYGIPQIATAVGVRHASHGTAHTTAAAVDAAQIAILLASLSPVSALHPRRQLYSSLPVCTRCTPPYSVLARHPAHGHGGRAVVHVSIYGRQDPHWPQRVRYTYALYALRLCPRLACLFLIRRSCTA